MTVPVHRPSGLRIKSAMTEEEEVGFDLFTLTFDSSPIKGEGDGGCVVIYVWSWFCSPFR